MYYSAVPGAEKLDPGRALVIEPDLDDHHYWCTRTCRPLGPHGAEACLNDCSPERECYEA